jgi:hypothetical protein
MSCSEQQYNSTDSGQQCAQQRHSTTHSEMPHTTAAAAAQRMAAQTRLLRMRRGLAHELHALGARGTLSSLQTRNETRISRPVAAETVQVFTGCVFADRKILRNAFLHSPAAAVRIVPCTRNTLVHTRVGHKCGKLARDRSVKCACARACPACACLRAASCCIPSFCCMFVSSPIMYFSDDSPGPAAGGAGGGPPRRGPVMRSRRREFWPEDPRPPQSTDGRGPAAIRPSSSGAARPPPPASRRKPMGSCQRLYAVGEG